MNSITRNTLPRMENNFEHGNGFWGYVVFGTGVSALNEIAGWITFNMSSSFLGSCVRTIILSAIGASTSYLIVKAWKKIFKDKL